MSTLPKSRFYRQPGASTAPEDQPALIKADAEIRDDGGLRKLMELNALPSIWD